MLALPALAFAAACAGNDNVSTGSLQHAQLSLAQGAAPAMANVASGLLADMDGGSGQITLSMVDSLIVHVSQVDVLPDSLLRRCFPVRGDSAHGFRPMDPDRPEPGDSAEHDSLAHRPPECRGHGMGMMGPGLGGGFGGGRFGFPRFSPDSLRPDSGFGRRDSDWYTLQVAGDGRLDLVHLPTDSASALILAAGDVPAGDYGAARLFLSDATIWFDTTVTVTKEDSTTFTFKPDTGYAVVFPHMEQRFGFVTNAGFTVPDGGGNVSLMFDANATIGGIAVDDSGRVRVRPIVRPRHPAE